MSEESSRETPFSQAIRAVQNDDVDTLRTLIRDDPAIAEQREPHGKEWALSHHAAAGGHLDALGYLLDSGLVPVNQLCGQDTGYYSAHDPSFTRFFLSGLVDDGGDRA